MSIRYTNDEIIGITRCKALKFLKLAKYQADLFSKDTTKVGCLFIDKDNLSILSCGYNGFIRKSPEPEERWCRPEKYKFVIHSELNCVINSARNGVKINGAIAVTTMFPCSDCMKALIQSGISSLITIEPDLESIRWGESFKLSLLILKELSIKVMYFTKNDLV